MNEEQVLIIFFARGWKCYQKKENIVWKERESVRETHNA